MLLNKCVHMFLLLTNILYLLHISLFLANKYVLLFIFHVYHLYICLCVLLFVSNTSPSCSAFTVRLAAIVVWHFCCTLLVVI